MISTYFIHLGVIVGIFAILAMSLNLALGYTGLINLGHIAFYGVGAYTSAVLTTAYGLPFWAGVVIGSILAGLLGLILTLITTRLKGDYFSLGTLGFAFVMYAVFLNWMSVTRGPLGIPGIKRPELFGWMVKTNTEYLFLVVGILALVAGFLFLLTRSRYGKLLEAVRDDALGAQSIGKNIFRLKIQAVVISAMIAGIAGSLYAHYISFIDPSTFYLNDIVIIVTIVIVGGLASMKGSLVAAAIILLLPEMLRFVDMPPSMIGPVRQMLYAVLLIGILMFRPRGLFGRIDLE